MQITYDQTKNRYYFDCTFEERNIPKQYKFKWCAEENRWFTDNWYLAFVAYKELKLRNCRELTQLNENINGSYDEGVDPFMRPTTEGLFKYQNAGVFQIKDRNNVLLADEQGLGKTAQGIGFYNYLEEYKEFKAKILVICRSSLKINWGREFQIWAKTPEADIQIVRKGKDTIDLNRRVTIVSYGLLESRYILDQLLEYGADIVIWDEGQDLKNIKTLRTKSSIKLGKKAKKVINITGTPVLNRPIELFPFLNAFSPETIAPYNDYRSFAHHFCGAYTDKWGHFNVDGADNLEELNIRLRATCMIRRLKKDVLDQLPDKMPPQIIAFEQDKETKAIIKKEKLLGIEDLKRHPAKMEIGETAKIRHELALAKLPKCIEYIEERLMGGNKLVVFAYHRDVIDALFDHFEELANACYLIGGQSAEMRQKSIDDFQNNPNCKIFIGQIQAAGVGITLTAASDVIFVENSWTPGEIDQCVDRCHRIGQKNSVTTTFLTVENSIEETMLKVVYDKRVNINTILK